MYIYTYILCKFVWYLVLSRSFLLTICNPNHKIDNCEELTQNHPSEKIEWIVSMKNLTVIVYMYVCMYLLMVDLKLANLIRILCVWSYFIYYIFSIVKFDLTTQGFHRASEKRKNRSFDDPIVFPHIPRNIDQPSLRIWTSFPWLLPDSDQSLRNI